MRDEKLDYSYNRVAATVLGIIQLVLGIGSVTVGIICIFQLTSFGFVGHGVWCGTMFIVAGSVVTAAGSKPTDCMVIAGTVLSAISVLLSLAQMGLSAIGLYYDISQDYCTSDCKDDPFIYCSLWVAKPQCLLLYNHNVSVILGAVLAILGLIEFAIGLATACLICACCSVKGNKVRPSTDSLSTGSARLPPSKGRTSNDYDLDDSRSNRTAVHHGVPQEWRLSYAN